MNYRGGFICRVGDGDTRRKIDAGEDVILADGRHGRVVDRCEGSYVFFYLVDVDGKTGRVETDKLTPVLNP